MINVDRENADQQESDMIKLTNKKINKNSLKNKK